MDKPPEDRRRHLSLVPDLPGGPQPVPAAAFRTPALFVVDPATADVDVAANRPRSPAPEVVLPAGTTTADLIRGLSELGVPQPFLEHASTFGDDVQALSAWLRDYGPVFSERQWTADLLDRWTPLLHPSTQAVDAEIFGHRFLSTHAELLADPEGISSLLHVIAEAVISRRPEALAMVRVLAHAGPEEIRPTAAAAVDELVRAGVPDQAWVLDLGCDDWVEALGYPGAGRQQVLAIGFRTGRVTQYLALLIDPDSGGGIRDCWSALSIGELEGRSGLADTVAGARAVRYDKAQAGILLNNALAAAPCPGNPDQAADVATYLPLLRSRAELFTAPPVTVLRPVGGDLVTTAAHQVKVTLDGIRPPIWRRLQVSSSCTLAELHLVVQAAFGWTGSSEWLFDTAGTRYGTPDPDAGIHDAGRFTLEGLAGGIGSRLGYRTDLADGWQHSIVVEGTTPSVEAALLPRCVGGRRAAPSEDSADPGRFSLRAVNQRLRATVPR